MLEIVSGEIEHCVVLRPTGELDASNSDVLRHALSEIGVDDLYVVVDLTQVPFIDSAGLGALFGGVRHLHALGAHVLLVGGTASTTRLLATTGVGELIPVVADMGDAAEALASHAAGLGRSVPRYAGSAGETVS
jgi:anti-sigma B factor antagonist